MATAEPGEMPDPIEQFEIKKHLDFEIFGLDASFTNSSLAMVISALIVAVFLILSMQGRALVPTRLQSLAEMSYEFIANMVREAAGSEGMKFFPLVFTLFMFILAGNLLGMFPKQFTFTSHLIITVALAMIVFLTVIIYGFKKNGAGFLKLFVPSGVPVVLVPLVTAIEVVSFLSRPLSHSVRLFANILAGHITLKVFAGFIVMLLGAGGATALLAPLPMLMTVAITALEFLVAFMQAYVFAMLTCMYLNDALHPSH